MNLYNSRQFMVIMVLVVVLFMVAIIRAVSQSEGDRCFLSRQGYVYELRGDIPKEGFYCFNNEQTLEEIIIASGVAKYKKAYEYDVPMRVRNGSRVTFSEDVKIENMDARARINFFLPLFVNSSPAEDIALIPGIGMQTARAIIDYKNKHQSIKNLQKLAAIKGIGEKKLLLLMPYLTVE